MLEIQRTWAMPNKNTFSIKPISNLIEEWLHGVSIDPFANTSKLASITNDINLYCQADYAMDATEFLKIFDDESVDVVLYDPPYSTRQISECYTKLGLSVSKETTQSSFWSAHKKEISRIVKKGGTVIKFGWNSGGIGKQYGFEIVKILMVAHGGAHNDTIVTVETKIS